MTRDEAVQAARSVVDNLRPYGRLTNAAVDPLADAFLVGERLSFEAAVNLACATAEMLETIEAERFEDAVDRFPPGTRRCDLRGDEEIIRRRDGIYAVGQGRHVRLSWVR